MGALRVMNVLYALVALAAARPCAAQSPEQAPEAPASSAQVEQRARSLFDEASREYAAGSYERALSLLREAYALVPRPGFLFNIAQAERKGGHCARARVAYAEYIAREPDPARRETAARLLESLGECRPASPVTPQPAAKPAPPPRPAPRRTAPRPAPPSVAVRPRGSPAWVNVATWSLIGAAAATAGAATYFTLQARSASEDVSAAREWSSGLSERQDQGRRATALAWIFAGASVGFGAGAVTLHVTRPPSGAPTAAALPAWGASWSGRF